MTWHNLAGWFWIFYGLALGFALRRETLLRARHHALAPGFRVAEKVGDAGKAGGQ